MAAVAACDGRTLAFMAGKVPQKPEQKKKGKSIKEKRQAKRAKKAGG